MDGTIGHGTQCNEPKIKKNVLKYELMSLEGWCTEEMKFYFPIKIEKLSIKGHYEKTHPLMKDAKRDL